MDDYGNEEEFSDDTEFAATPKGFFISLVMSLGHTSSEADELWFQFEGFCVRTAPEEATHAALVFDGCGGVVVGASSE